MLTSRSPTFFQSQDSLFPTINLKESVLVSPSIDRIKKLHESNIKIVKKHHLHHQTLTDELISKKNNYFGTIQTKKQSACNKVLQKLKNKSQLLGKELIMKSKRQQSNLKNANLCIQQKQDTFYNNQLKKQKQATEKRQVLMTTRSKCVMKSIQKQAQEKRQKVQKIFEQQLSKSQELQKRSLEKIVIASNKRNLLKRHISETARGIREEATIYAQKFMEVNEVQKTENFLSKSIIKLKRGQHLIEQQRSIIAKKVKLSKENNSHMLSKTLNNKISKQKSNEEILERILQQRNEKIQQANQSRQKNLKFYSSTLRQSRSRHFKQMMKKSTVFKFDSEAKSQVILDKRAEKWKNLKNLKQEFVKTKNQLFYETQQFTLRG